ncbi:MAG: ADP-forming succinate--CoA ligase subunit beta [Peptococcaceae bacterium]|nr:ADP-forming succinate--CoA ligase subunit beta [Peptococcaceae bacterium]
MKLFEYMGKEILSDYGVRVPRGKVASSPGEAVKIASYLDSPVVIKSQILSGKRGKGGGIAFPSSIVETENESARILGSIVQGFIVDKLLVEEKIQIDRELYLAITVDSTSGKPLILASLHGGVDIEEVPDDYLVRYYIDPLIGLKSYDAREIARKLGLKDNIAKEMISLLQVLYKIFREKDAELLEINPLVVSGDSLVAADAKITIDDEALFRHPELPYVEEKTNAEKRAHDAGLSYVRLEGDIAVMANGAGITMGTLDTLEYFNGRPANFMDAGGGTGMAGTVEAIKILLDSDSKVILINIFGGITRCDDVANALVKVKNEIGIPVPVVIRLVGTNEEIGLKILEDNGFTAYKTMHEAAAQAVAIANR